MGPPNGDWHLDRFPQARIDWLEPLVSLPNSSPALIVLSLIGVATAFRNKTRFAAFRTPLLAALFGGALILIVASVSHRYTHEFYPFFVMAAAVGINKCASVESRTLSGVSIVLLLAGLSVSTYIDVGTAFLHIYARPEVRDKPFLWYTILTDARSGENGIYFFRGAIFGVAIGFLISLIKWSSRPRS